MQSLIKNNPIKEVRRGWIAIAVIAIALFGFYLFYEYSDASLKKKFILTKGVVSDTKDLYKAGEQVYYVFYINGKYYDGTQPMPKLKNSKDRFILEGKIFPVVVDTTNYSNNRMLFDSVSFVYYGLQYPDSLEWLKEFLLP